MSEEQKEYEAMQLVNLMDKMQRQVTYFVLSSDWDWDWEWDWESRIENRNSPSADSKIS